MLHRTFIAINLQNNIKDKILDYRKDFLHIPAKWVEKENLHITLNFLGNLDDTQLMETIGIIEGVVENYESFVLNIEQMGFDNKKPPRLIWLTLKKNQILNNLYQELEDNIYNLDSYQFKTREQRNFNAHITLARIKGFEAKRLQEQDFDIKKTLNLSFEVNSIEIMESELKKTGPEYTILRSFEL